jgi:hypothetical protein
MSEIMTRTFVVIYVVLFFGFWIYLTKKKGWAFEWGFCGAGLIAGLITVFVLEVIKYIYTGEL